ncbi:MAG TPA: alanine racemase [Longimicrobium sp.]|nr:alanine racemase [Longimicrobium sp.]
MSALDPRVRRAGVEAPGPAYVYDLGRLRRRARRLAALPIARRRLFFATMANDHPAVLACVRDAGVGVFVNSPAHLKRVLRVGFAPGRVVYAASNMLPDEMRECVALGVNLVLDSVGQVRALAEAGAAGAEIGVRMNVGSALDRGALRFDPGYRFGLLPSELADAVAAARRGGVRIVGAHSYFGTGVMRPETLLEGLERLGAAAYALPDLRYLDVGGGFGVPDTLDGDEFDLEGWAEGADGAVRRLERRLGRELQLYVEPGRWLAADCGFYFVKVVDRKVRGDRAFVGTNGSVAQFPRPLLYPDHARHPCELAEGAGGRAVHPRPVWVCGNSTYSQDFLARGIDLPLPEPGETLVFHYAGAYGRSMATRFLGKGAPREIFIPAEAPAANEDARTGARTEALLAAGG